MSRPCSLATSAKAIQSVTGPSALRLRWARRSTSLLCKPEPSEMIPISAGIEPSALSRGKSLPSGLVILGLVGLAGAWVVGAMAMLGINWNVLTIMITALTIGLGIDYSIHVWRRIEANRNSGMRTWEAMRDMYSTTGTALLLSASTTICGFMVLLLSPIPVIQDFGVVSSISVLFSLVMALLVLPGLLAAEFRSGNGF